MDVVHDIIAWKRDGNELDDERLHAFVRGVVDGSVAPYQASALLMAIVLRGLSDQETVSLARAMVTTGKTLDLSLIRRPVLDKHSSGGVGDKVTLVLAPLVAACGGVFGKMSGRGLGHTGGTLDKLESVPGFRVQLSQGDFIHQLERIGVAVVSQSERIVPADKILYALRDVTATVDERGLIAASIMAKKIASGTSAVALDIKVGAGAFMRTLDEARELGRLCAAVGDAFGRPVKCLLHRHGEPARTGGRQPSGGGGGLGGAQRRAGRTTCARWRSSWPACCSRCRTSASMRQEGRRRAAAALDDGTAAAHFDRWCLIQGGRWRPGEFHRLAAAEVTAPRSGVLTRVDAFAVGRAAQLSGAGRLRADDAVDPAAGVVLSCAVGDPVEAGQVLATVFARDAARRQAGRGVLAEAFSVGDEAPARAPIVLGRG